ncbi:SDR family oxidoreductase [Algoriphagus aestuariicola]|uniref:SDR family oxidoreductase n=1 Tax=Algoriphagus aestuariicola TaxID=1852016 RepID=A0ABS3BK91_9BACT|nr:SDR family oxidoreductase [Algoriphagus aestuariicola]MBN7799706.1 SDR family oxidoreductase [Algoriphagus aestuariicola]
MKIGVSGATGQLGRIVLNELKKRGVTDQVVALARNVEKASELGVEAREFDYSNADMLAKSLQGIDTLLLISSSEVGKRAIQHGNVIDAAKSAGVKWIIYTSLLHADRSSLSLAGEHLATEKILKESGIEYTILRNGWYTENYAGSIPGALGAGAMIGSARDGKISSAARADFAEAAAVVLLDEKHKGNVYELAGDESYTLQDLAAEVSKQSGKSVPYKDLPEAEYAKALTQFGLPEGLAAAIAGWDVSASKGDLFDDGKQLSSLIGRPTTPMAETVTSFVS